MAQEKMEERSGFWTRRRQTLCGVVAVTLFACLGAAFFFFRPAPSSPPAPIVQEEGGIGIVDMARAEKAHEAYAQLAELETQRAAIVADIGRLSFARQALKPPALADDPFRRAAEQKRLQQERLAAGEREHERRKALAAWEEETQDAFLAEKKAIEDSYQIRIVNLEMKLDNREAMGLTIDEAKALLEELETLRKERGERMKELFAARDEARRSYLASLAARDAKSGKHDAKSAQEEAARLKAEAERRNSEALMQAMQGIELDEILRRKKTALTAKDEEIRIIREHIRKDIESKVAKLALVHRLALVVTKETDEAESVKRADPEMDAPSLRFPVAAPAAHDLTEEVIAELTPGNILERSGNS